MKPQITLIAALALSLPLLAVAQDAAPKAKAAGKAAHAAHAAPKKAPIKRSAAKAVEEVTPVSSANETELSESDLALARRVNVGRMQCELGSSVSVQLDEKKPGFFNVSTGGQRYRMHPVESRTGAIRLEDAQQGAVWLQLGNKSMLMNQKMGLRIADECQNAEQVAVSEDMKKNPPKPLFDGADVNGVRASDTAPAAGGAATPAAAHATTGKKPAKKTN